MLIADSVIVVTGAGGGIGAELARRFVAAGARAVELVDRRGKALQTVADELGPVARVHQLDVTDESAMSDLVAAVLDRHGRIDLFCSNAGIATGVGLQSGPLADGAWGLAWNVHVMAQVYAARAVVPAMIAAGGGYLLNTASAAGLLTAPGDAPYAATKHAAVAFAEWLAIEYAELGIKVSVLCPMGVDTPLLSGPLATGNATARSVAASGPILSVGEVADAVIEGLATETFLILPHAEVAQLWSAKAADVQSWLADTRRIYDLARAQKILHTEDARPIDAAEWHER
ncbi:SDR family oxidoreductase [Jatrophihabitans sp. DSM 45814]